MRRRRRAASVSIWTFVAPAALVVAIVIAVSVVAGARGTGSSTGSKTTVNTATSRTTSTGSTAVSTKKRYYRVKAGDTFDAIEKRYRLSAGALTDLNPSVDPLTIQPGQRLRVR